MSFLPATLKTEQLRSLYETDQLKKGFELIKPPKNANWPPKLFTPKMAEIMPPQNWYGQSKIA